MALYTRHASITVTADQLIPRRPPTARTTTVTAESALRHSAVWACLRLRANLMSTLPIDVYRTMDGRPVEMPKPPVLVNPGGERVDMLEWMYSTQMDLDRGGNCFGLITARDGGGRPQRIDLVPLSEVSVEVRNYELAAIRIGGERYDAESGKINQVWHEKQYTMAGLHVGLSPVAYAAWTIGEYLSIQEFAVDWFSNSVIPAARLKHAHKTVSATQAAEVKAKYRESTGAGDLFVHGADWDFEMIGATAAETNWIEAKELSISDIARYFDCPGDLIDAAVKGGNITYARVDTRQLQFLVNHLGPAILRRENALSSRILARPRFVKLNTKALLRMDAKTQAEIFQLEINSRTRTPDEVRELRDEMPLTEADKALFDRLFGSKNLAPSKAAVPAGPTETPAIPGAAND